MTPAVLWPLVALVWAASAAADTGADAPPRAGVEGAIGLVLRHDRSTLASVPGRLRLSPGGFLRWRWLTITGSGGFTTRTREDVQAGLSADVLPVDGVRLRLGLSVDRGRRASAHPEWAGLGDISPTLRGRLTLGWTPRPDWQLTVQGNTDLLDRGGGHLAQFGLSRSWNLGGGNQLSAGASLSWASADYAAQRYGVNDAQAAASGRPGFNAGAGWQGAQVQWTWRGEFTAWGQPFGAMAGLSYGRVLGDASRSPLVSDRHSTGLGVGLVWRF